MIIRRRFRPLGKILQRFGRGQINNYTHTTNMASRADVPPVWEDDAQQPLIWSDPDVVSEPADLSSEAAPPPVQRRAARGASAPEPAPAPDTSASGPRRTPPDLWKIHDLHTQMLEEEGYKMPPSPWAAPVDPATASRLPAPPSGSKAPVQRRAQPAPAPDPTPASRPANIPTTPAPPTISGRRRGRVIEEKTPLEMSDDAQPDAPEPDSPDWETELESGEDRPDLFEALMSEGVVQRRPNPDLSDAETFTPQFRPAPPETFADQTTSPGSEAAPDAPASVAPHVQRSEAVQPPRPRSARQISGQAPDTSTPVQRRESAAPPESGSPYYAADDAQLPPALVPAPGTTEADLLDMLGLPSDTPVRGLNPAAAAPSDAPSQPASPAGLSSAPAAPVQRSESAAPRNPTRPAAGRVNVPPTSPYKSQTSGEQISPQEPTSSADSSAPTSATNPTVMRQPEMPEASADEPADSDADDWSEPPAVSNFTSFFEAAETAQTGGRAQNMPVEPDSYEWSQPSDSYSQAGESLPRANPFPTAAEPPPTPTSSSAPTRPTPRVQRAPVEPELPYVYDADAPETVSDFEDTQPIDVPLASSAPTPETGSRASIQRDAEPPADMAGESYPRAVDPALLSGFDAPDDWSEPGESQSQPPASSVQPSQAVTPRSSGAVSSPPAAAVQRTDAPQAEPAHTPSDPPQVGYHIEGLPDNRGTAPADQVSRFKTGGVTGGDKLGGKIVPEGLSMALPGKTTTSSGSSSVTAPSSGSSSTSGTTDPGNVPPPQTDWAEPAMTGGESAPSSTASSSTAPAAPDESGSASPNEEAGDQNDVDKLARDVYNLLRDRLRVEQERRPKR